VKRDLESLRHELDVLSRLARALVTTTRLDDLLAVMVREVGELLDFDDCVLYLWDDSEQVLVQRAAWGPKYDRERRAIVDPLRLRLGEGIVGSVAANRLVEIVHDVQTDRRYVPDATPGGSELTVPILHLDRLVGVLDAESQKKSAFSAADAVVLTRFSDLCASAIVGVQRLELDAQSVEEALRRSEERLRHLSTHDQLTGLLDRVRFQEQLQAALATAATAGADVAVALVSLGRFDLVNAAIGTAEADELLRRVAGILRAHARRGDIVARIAGVEFGLLLRGTTTDEAVPHLQTIVTEIASLPVPEPAPALAASAGISAIAPGEVVGMQALLARAVRARRAAEETGAGVATE
jgi:diguanylate cyclase (GGDEF)-like protein